MKVSMYKASDGALFEHHWEFIAHEGRLNVQSALESATLDTSAFNEDDRGGRVLHEAAIAEFIVTNATTLRTLLNDAMVMKRGPRNPKTDNPPA